MRIGLDMMGGDFAPQATVGGIAHAREALPKDVELVMLGDKDIFEPLVKKCDCSMEGMSFIHADQKIGMSEHPVKAISDKPRSSISMGFTLLAKGELDGFCSAGNTGAMLAGAMFTIKSIPGIIRPAIAVGLPRMDGGFTILLDVGLNPDARPDVLYQWGKMGSLYMEHIYKVKNPKVGLLNIGSEEDKGNLLTKSTYQIMKNSSDFNFIGNVEGNELFIDKVDVVVADGFTGNVVLKQTESFYYLMKKVNIDVPFVDNFNYENFGGTPILGIGSPVLIGHGISSPLAIKNMILQNKKIIESGLTGIIRKAFQ